MYDPICTLAYWLKRWNGLYDKILANLAADPNGKIGKELATEWRTILDDYFSVGSKDFLNGILLWQETARQDEEIKSLKTIPTPQEMMDRVHIMKQMGSEQMGSSLAFCLMTLEWQKARLDPICTQKARLDPICTQKARLDPICMTHLYTNSLLTSRHQNSAI